MDSAPAIYLGRIVKKEYFRAVIYGPNGLKKIAESWDAFELAMASGLWFATVEDAKASEAAPEPEKPKRARRAKKAVTAVEVLEEADSDDEVHPAEDLAFEVEPEDDFLPKKG